MIGSLSNLGYKRNTTAWSYVEALKLSRTSIATQPILKIDTFGFRQADYRTLRTMVSESKHRPTFGERRKDLKPFRWDPFFSRLPKCSRPPVGHRDTGTVYTLVTTKPKSRCCTPD